MVERVLVTGATGTIGRQLIPMLTEYGLPVRALVRDVDRASSMFRGHTVELVPGDFDELTSLRAATSGARSLFLVSGDGKRQVDFERNVIEAARSAGVRHIVKISSSDVGLRDFVWARRHADAEALVRESGIAFSFLRPDYFMVNYLSLLFRNSDRDLELRMPGGDGLIPAIDPFDIAECAASVLTRGTPTGTHHLLTGPEGLGYQRVADAFSEVLGEPVACVGEDEDAFTSRMALAGSSPAAVADLLDSYRVFRGECRPEVSDEIERLTGRPPRSIIEFARANSQRVIEMAERA